MAQKTSERMDVGTKVVAAMDLRDVPAGTRGKVRLANGLTWKRFWVQFDNGVWLGSIDRRALATRDEWERRDEIAAAAAAAAARTEAEAPAAAAGDTGAVEPEAAAAGGVPAHLLERAKRARERAAAKNAEG